ncbi:proclotting enzyme-like isoform X2 [Ornithodoros turicata]|uniref:proclotting enzyme-like isoform X2 n=1 Tax=Ornithodoros turicata TaxID=34597 RepID=UPI003139A46B
MEHSVSGSIAKPAILAWCVLVTFDVLNIAVQASQECGEKGSSKYRIVGGVESEVGAWPWMALLYLPLSKGNAPEPACGGALITPRHVLTAAHCLRDEERKTRDPTVMKVRLGEHDLETNTESEHADLEVSQVLVHEGYDENLMKHDLGLLVLAQDAPLGRGINLVCLPKDEDQWAELSGKTAVIAGWGAQSDKGKMSSTLQEVMLPILSQTKCEEALEGLVSVDKTVLCASALGKDSCKGDSGGPMVVPDEKSRFTVVGVTAFGVHCGDADFPGVYTRVTEHMDWINENIRTTGP